MFARYTPVWSGWPGAPGYTTFHFDGVPNGADASTLGGYVRNFFEAIKTHLPTAIQIDYPGEMTLHNDDGTLTGAVALTTIPASTDCTGIGVYASPVGARVTWETGTVVGGRRLRGRTFIVPLVASDYDTSGSLLTTAVSALTAAASGLVVAADASTFGLVTWSPTTSTTARVTSAFVPDQATVLRTRRD